MQTFGTYYNVDTKRNRKIAHIEKTDNPFWENSYKLSTAGIVDFARTQKDGAGNYTPYAHALAIIAYRIDKSGHFNGENETLINSLESFNDNLFCGYADLRAFWESFMWDESTMPYAVFERAYNYIVRYFFGR